MHKKNLQNILKNEGQKFVPNNVENIYKALGISYIKEKVEAEKVEKALQSEGEKFTPNKIDRVYAMLGIEQGVANANSYATNHLKDEANDFVPNVKGDVYSSINQPSPKKSLVSRLLKPIPLGVAATFLVAAISVSAVLLSNRNKIIQTGETVNDASNDEHTSTDTGSQGETQTEVSLNNASTISMSVRSASQLYNPSIFYAANSDGNVDNSTIIPLDDEANNIVTNFGKSRAITNTYSIKEFTTTYLLTALNLGYIERQDSTKLNTISITFRHTEEDSDYFVETKKELEQEIKDFMRENRVMASFELNSTEEEETGTIDSELDVLIRTAYAYATRLFVTEDGTAVKIFCFSTDYNDWVERFKDSSLEDMRDYVSFLKGIDEMITNKEMKQLFVSQLQECNKYQEATDIVVEKYEYLEEIYTELVKRFNEAFNEHMPEHLEPLDGGKWDWWDDYGHEHPFDDHGHGPKPKDWRHNSWDEDDDEYSIEGFADYISELEAESFEVDEGADKHAYEYKLQLIRAYGFDLREYYMNFTDAINESFDGLMVCLLDGDFMCDYIPEDHYMDEPDDWDDDFDDWWHQHF